MKTPILTYTNAFSLLKTLMILMFLAACAETNLTPVPNTSGVQDLNTPPQSNMSANSLAGNYNLEAILRSDGNSASGLVKFRQYMDETQMIHLNVWVRDLEPNTSYVLQRAVDTNLDGNCTGTNWLTLGKGLTPQSIATDDSGTGEAELFRSVAAIPVGTSFDIHFRVLKEGTTMVSLTSDCYQYTVH